MEIAKNNYSQSLLYRGISVKTLIVFYFIFSFSFRPIIDLGWSLNLIAGMNLAGIFSILNILMFLFYCIINKKIYKAPIPITIFILYIFLVTILFKFNSLDEWSNFFRIISSVPYFFIAKDLNNKKFNQIMNLFLICTLVPILISYLQYLGYVSYSYYDYVDGSVIARASGGYRQPSHLTRYLCFGELYSLYFILNNKQHKLSKILYIILAGVSVLISYHRTGYIIYSLVFLAFLIAVFIKNKVSFLKLIVYLFLFIFIVLTVLDYYKFVDVSNVNKLFSKGMIFSSEGITLRGRGGIIDFVCDSFSINPLYNVILGNGGHSNNVTNLTLSVADMDILKVVWNYGIIGLILYIFLNLFFVFIILKNKKMDFNTKWMLISLLIIYFAFGIILETITTPNITSTIYLLVLFTIIN